MKLALMSCVRDEAEVLPAFLAYHRVVARISETQRLYHGERLDRLPDLLVEWTKDGAPCRVASPKIGVLERRYTGVRTGDHTPGGLLAALGPGVPRAHLDRCIDVMDLAPTIAALLGERLADSDGERIAELCPGVPA